mgnify:CR=1 FL=1|jgi:hypothetical protein
MSALRPRARQLFTHHQQVVPACGRDLQGPSRHRLPPHIPQIGQIRWRGQMPPRHGPALQLLPGEVVGKGDKTVGRDDVDVVSRPGRFRAGRCRADNAEAACIGRHGGGQDAAHMGQPPIETELAKGNIAVQRVLRNGAKRPHQRQSDGQIVVASFLGQISRRQIDGNALGRQAQTRRHQRRTNPFPALPHGLVGQANQNQAGKTRRNLRLYVHRHGLNPLKGHCRHTGDHWLSPQSLQRRLAEAGRISKNEGRTNCGPLTMLNATMVTLKLH